MKGTAITVKMMTELLNTGKATNVTDPVVYESKPSDLFSDSMYA